MIRHDKANQFMGIWGISGDIRGCGKYVCGEYMSRSKHELDSRFWGYQSFNRELNIHKDPH